MVDGKAVPLSFSYGVYELRAGETPDTAMQQADRAMYAQKRSGRSCYARLRYAVMSGSRLSSIRAI